MVEMSKHMLGVGTWTHTDQALTGPVGLDRALPTRGLQPFTAAVEIDYPAPNDR